MIKEVILLVSVSIAFVFALVRAIDTPDVIFSWETKQCVKVINADGSAGDCNNLPDRYTHIWGK